MTGSSPVSEDRFDFVLFFSIYKVWWRSEEVQPMLRCFLIAGEKGGVEDGVDLPFGGNVEAERRS